MWILKKKYDYWWKKYGVEKTDRVTKTSLFERNWATWLKPRRRSRPFRLVWWALDMSDLRVWALIHLECTVPVIMVLYIYQYWFKMLKWWKFPPLIKARTSSMNCTMGNLTCSCHATYLHAIYVKSREIHILSTIQILTVRNEIKT